MARKKKLVPGRLFNDQYPYPVGKLFTDEKEYKDALKEGWKEGPPAKKPGRPAGTGKSDK